MLWFESKTSLTDAFTDMLKDSAGQLKNFSRCCVNDQVDEYDKGDHRVIE